jgi:hypothetical protein
VGLAVLGIIVTRWSSETLTSADFGIGQVGTAVAGLVLIVGLLSGMALLAAGPWSELSQDPELVPAFIGADAGGLGAYRVLLVDREADGTVGWDVTDDRGPRMTAFGTLRNRDLTNRIGQAVTQIVQGDTSSAAALLGVLNVRYVVLETPDPGLRTAMSQQTDLEPLSSSAATTYRVRTWLPRASVVPEPIAGRLLATGDPGPTDGLGEGALIQERPGVFRGGRSGPNSGLLVVSEAGSTAWRAVTGNIELPQVELGPVNGFTVDTVQDNVRVVAGGGLRRRIVVAVQLLLALAVISLAVRPPGTRAVRRPVTSLPGDLVGIADTTTTIPRIDPANPPRMDGRS